MEQILFCWLNLRLVNQVNWIPEIDEPFGNLQDSPLLSVTSKLTPYLLKHISKSIIFCSLPYYFLNALQNGYFLLSCGDFKLWILKYYQAFCDVVGVKILQMHLIQNWLIVLQ